MSSSQTQTTRTFLEKIFNQMGQPATTASFVSVLADDLKWTVTGSSPLTGVYTSKLAYLDQVLQPILARLESPVHPTVHLIIAEGEWASVHFSSKDVKAKNGVDFSMQYVWLIKVQAEKIVEVVGFYDQKKLADIFL